MNLNEEIIIAFPEKLGQLGDEDEEFPSLVGGQPVWFNDKACPESMKCKQCGKEMTFLMQLYAPLEMEQAYHRVIYIFFCQDGRCVNRKESIRVLRIQQSQNTELKEFINPHFSASVLEKSYKVDPQTLSVELNKQLEKEYQYKTNPFEVDDKEFLKKKNKENYEKENKLLKQFTQMAMEDPDFGKELDKQMAAETWDDDDEEDDLDQAFEKYSFLLKEQEGHFLRYCRNKETLPLWYSDKNQWVPPTQKCKNCGKNLIFEFQVNSTVLNHFPSLIEYDWGIIAIYTCENSCKSASSIVEEHCELQVLLEKEQVEQSIKNHLKNVEKYVEEGEEEEQKVDGKLNEENQIGSEQLKKSEDIKINKDEVQVKDTQQDKPKPKKNKKKQKQNTDKAKEENVTGDKSEQDNVNDEDNVTGENW